MGRLDPKKLHVHIASVWSDVLSSPRCYTLTHSDRTGDLYLTIGSGFNREQISGLYTRLMRDEVIAEWKKDQGLFILHVYCHVTGGFVFGTSSLRDSIFRRELPLVLEAIRYGDGRIFANKPGLDKAEVFVHFQKPKAKDCKVELWGHIGDYIL